MKIETQSSTMPVEDLLSDLRLLVEESEEIARYANDRSTEETVAELRTRVEAAEERLECYAQIPGRPKRRGTMYLQRVMRSNPTQSLAIAFGVGTVAGFLIGRHARFSSPRR